MLGTLDLMFCFSCIRATTSMLQLEQFDYFLPAPMYGCSALMCYNNAPVV